MNRRAAIRDRGPCAPSTQVDTTRAAPISSGGPANGSRSSTTRSATAPTSTTPASSRWFTHALPEVYAANATSSGSACSGRNGSVPARPGVAVRRAGDRGVDRGQRVGGRDRPVAARDQPGAGPVQGAEGVLPRRPLLPQERQRQVDHLVVVAGPERLHVGGDAELGEPRHVVGVDQLQVGDVVAPGRVGADHRVQRLAHRPVADGVHVHLEAGGVQGGHGVLDRLGVQEGVAAVVGGVAAAVEVRLEQRGGAVLGHAVLHHLHGGGAEPAAGQRLTPPDQVRDLLDALPPVPPQRADDVRAELAARGRVDVRRRRGRPCRSTSRRSRPASW